MVVFTLRSIAEELWGRVDFEIMAVNNYCEEMKKQGQEEDKAGGHIEGCSKGYEWLKALRYTKKLSHWQAKNLGVRESDGEFLMFIDAHCSVTRDSIFNQYNLYKEHWRELNGTLHLPLTYHILEYHKLIYKLKINWDAADVHYSFTPYRDEEAPFRVPCMSTCGMMMHRSIYDELEGWPEIMGIYGGGENFINFTLAVLGKTVNIMPGPPLCHHGDKRSYYWNGDDYVRNRCAATYIFGGTDLARTFVDNRKGSRRVLYGILNSVLDSCSQRRAKVKENQKLTIQEWAAMWGQ